MAQVLDNFFVGEAVPGEMTMKRGEGLRGREDGPMSMDWSTYTLSCMHHVRLQLAVSTRTCKMCPEKMPAGAWSGGR